MPEPEPANIVATLPREKWQAPPALLLKRNANGTPALGLTSFWPSAALVLLSASVQR